MAIDIGKILDLTKELINIKKEIQSEIQKEQDAKRRKKLQKLCDKNLKKIYKKGELADLIDLRADLFKY